MTQFMIGPGLGRFDIIIVIGKIPTPKIIDISVSVIINAINIGFGDAAVTIDIFPQVPEHGLGNIGMIVIDTRINNTDNNSRVSGRLRVRIP